MCKIEMYRLNLAVYKQFWWAVIDRVDELIESFNTLNLKALFYSIGKIGFIS